MRHIHVDEALGWKYYDGTLNDPNSCFQTGLTQPSHVNLCRFSGQPYCCVAYYDQTVSRQYIAVAEEDLTVSAATTLAFEVQAVLEAAWNFCIGVGNVDQLALLVRSGTSMAIVATPTITGCMEIGGAAMLSSSYGIVLYRKSTSSTWYVQSFTANASTLSLNGDEIQVTTTANSGSKADKMIGKIDGRRAFIGIPMNTGNIRVFTIYDNFGTLQKNTEYTLDTFSGGAGSNPQFVLYDSAASATTKYGMVLYMDSGTCKLRQVEIADSNLITLRTEVTVPTADRIFALEAMNKHDLFVSVGAGTAGNYDFTHTVRCSGTTITLNDRVDGQFNGDGTSSYWGATGDITYWSENKLLIGGYTTDGSGAVNYSSTCLYNAWNGL